MHCPQCGNEINVDDNFCSGCGNRNNKAPQQADLKNKILTDIAHGKRVACKDGCCTGAIGNDGTCRTCGKPLEWIDEDRLEDEKLYEFEQQITREREAKNSELKCPHCGSAQLSAQKKGFGLGKAAAGGILLGGVGLLCGVIGSGKIKIICLKCGHSWKAGKA